MSTEIPAIARTAVLVKSDATDVKDSQVVRGHDFNEHSSSDLDSLMKSYMTTGFQATNLALAVEEINRMLHFSAVDDEGHPYKCTIFLGYTSNMMSCGLREITRFLVQHSLVNAIVTTAGAIEEDFIKCMAPTFIGDFSLDGAKLRDKGLNRIGNLLVPNDNYCSFEDWFAPVLARMLKEQKENGTLWSPSKIIDRMGEEINNPESVYYWCHKNQIPVFCPAITDGAIGDNIFFNTFRNPGFVVDIVSDIRAINLIAMNAKCTGMIILGGGVIKHHICNANLMRNGSDFTVFVNTAQEFDGSDAGARPDEAVSWGKIKPGTRAIKVYAEATIVWPLIVSQTFAKVVEERKKQQQK